ncbi:MAG: hypothetical protein EZS28_046179, partial [Streblomastix strix]
MSTVTGSSYIKFGAENTVVLLATSGTKPISEQYGTKYDIDDTFIKKTDKNLQLIEGYLRESSEPKDVSDDDDDYTIR